MDLATRLAMAQTWAIEQRALDGMIEALNLKVTGLSEAASAALMTRAQGPAPMARGNVGVIQIRGVLRHHAPIDIFSLLFGGTASTTEQIAEALREQLADDAIRAVVLDIDSPGGNVAGIGELAEEIYRSRGRKPIVALANDNAASAAYWIASAADVVYATPSALVGSIGVYVMHVDDSAALEAEGVKVSYIQAGKFKTEGNAHEPLGDEARAHMQEIVDDDYDRFVKAVARGRGVSEATVRNGYGQGRVVTAKRAKALGLIDGIYTLEQTISRSVGIKPGKPGDVDEAAAAEAEANERLTADIEEGRKRLALERWRALQAEAEMAQGEV